MAEMTEKLLTGTLSLNKTNMFSCWISSHNGNRLSRPIDTHTRRYGSPCRLTKL